MRNVVSTLFSIAKISIFKKINKIGVVKFRITHACKCGYGFDIFTTAKIKH